MIAESNLIPLRAGAVEMFFEVDTGFLRRVRLEDCEVLRCVYAAVRDHNWRTPQPELSKLQVEVEDDRFVLSFDSLCRHGDIHFGWTTSITGDRDGSVSVAFDGRALSTFRKNRIGLCVLHPIRECSGARARQTRTDGSQVDCRFPDLIEPQIFGRASFRDLRGVAHEVQAGLWAELRFEGETFEMEDQRNWTDASFKVYGTPLADPFPVEMPIGTRVQQSVRLRFAQPQGASSSPATPAGPARSDRPPAAIVIRLPAEPNAHLPLLGVCLAEGHDAPDLHASKLDHLRVDLHLGSPRWIAELHRSARCGLPLELALHLPADGEESSAEEVAEICRQQSIPLSRVLALHKGEDATSQPGYELIKRVFLDVAVGAGSDCNFCELNRAQSLGRLAADPDFLFWSIAAMVHASDPLSVMETLEAQGATVHSGAAFADGAPLIASPITLTQRFNPVGTDAEPALPTPAADNLPTPLFGAAWTLGSIAAMSLAGLSSATYFDSHASRGALSDLMDSLAGGGAARVSMQHGSAPFSAIGLDGQILVANLARRRRTMAIGMDQGKISSLDFLKESGGWQSSPMPPISDGLVTLEFAPYGIARFSRSVRKFESTSFHAASR